MEKKRKGGVLPSYFPVGQAGFTVVAAGPMQPIANPIYGMDNDDRSSSFSV